MASVLLVLPVGIASNFGHEENLICIHLVYTDKYGLPQNICDIQMMVKSFLINNKK